MGGRRFFGQNLQLQAQEHLQVAEREPAPGEQLDMLSDLDSDGGRFKRLCLNPYKAFVIYEYEDGTADVGSASAFVTGTYNKQRLANVERAQALVRHLFNMGDPNERAN